MNLRRYAFLLPVFLGTELAVMILGTAFAGAVGLSNIAPSPQNSTPPGAHVFLLRNSQDNGQQEDVQLAAYFQNTPAGSPPVTGAYISLMPGTGLGDEHVCSKQDTGDTAANRRYITVTLSNKQRTFSKNYHIPYSGACDQNNDRTNKIEEDANNKFYAKYPIPGNVNDYGVDGETGMYRVNIDIAYHSLVPEGNSSAMVQQRFIVESSRSGTKIGQLGGGVRSFPIVGDWSWGVRSESSTQIEIPFGLSCTTTTDQNNKKIGVYDADNGNFPPLSLKFRVFKLNDDGSIGTRISLKNDSNGNINNETFTPSTGGSNAQYAGVEIDMKADTRYVMVIYEVEPNNTIDIKIPGDSIFGDIDCGWKMRPDSKVEPTIQQPNGWVKFTHTATNTGKFKSDPVTSKVKWGKDGVLKTGTVSTDTDSVYDPTNGTVDRTWTNDYRIPAAALNNQQYCQYLEVKPHSKKDSNAYDSWTKGDRACVTVVVPPIPGPKVEVRPSVSASPTEMEPTEFGTFDSGVRISNFPQPVVGGWGFDEIAKYGDPVKQRASNPSYRATTTDLGRDTASKNGCVQYTNPSAPRGPCIKWKWECDGRNVGEYASRPTCPHRGYRHVCQTYERTNSSSTFNCTDKWVCPSPASTTPTYGSEPNCRVWKCAYGGSNYYDTAADGDVEQHCEKRCSGGSGLRPERYTSGDMNCYQRPTFTLTCYWNGKPAFTQTVSANGTDFCDSRELRQGVTIGTDVCATLTVNYPTGGWSASVPPGYGSDNGGASFRQIQTWSWDNLPSVSANACIEVVGKPTVKIRGGDVAAGGAFSNGTNCTMSVNTAGIAGWPHAPDYNASGTQFGAFAAGSITGFSTNMIVPRVPRDLAFANRPLSGGERFGGSFSSTTPCIPDYYSESSQVPDTQIRTFDQFNSGTPSGAYKSTTGGEISNLLIQQGKRITLYVDGNVYISGNHIKYDRNNWVSVGQIPGFKLVVKGNIYIAPTVRELNGIYVAQPRSATVGGNIYTCANPTAVMPSSQIYNNCQNLLTVNGAFIAKKVHLLRSQGTAIRGETSEQFNYLPELWLTDWAGSSSSNSVKYDAIIALPPIL